MGGKISMKKKLMSVLLAAAMVASMAVGCGSDKKAASDSGDTKKTESTEKKTESNQILFNGSSTLAPVITSMATTFFDTYGTWDAYDSSLPKEDIAIYVSAGGSGQGTKAVIDGTSTFGMVARSIKDEEKEAIKDEKEYQVETIGQFSVRGGILDIFPLTEENPIRIEFWGDEIDTIRYFDCESQKSIESVDEISIYPASEIVLTDEKKSEGIQKMLDEAERVSEKLRKDMKTEEAYRVSSTAKELAEEWGELSMYAGMDAFLSYFFDEKVGLLDYFDKDNTLIFFDELTRCFEQGKLTETEVSESMKHRLASGYVLPGQMKEQI